MLMSCPMPSQYLSDKFQVWEYVPASREPDVSCQGWKTQGTVRAKTEREALDQARRQNPGCKVKVTRI